MLMRKHPIGLRECDQIKHYILLFLFLILSMPAVTASNGYVGVTGLEITGEYVHVESAYPTSGVDGGYYRHYGCPYFLNYCSGCGCYGTISFEQCSPENGVIPGFTSVEGMYFCTNCDRDYSCISGIDHGYEGIYLYRYAPPIPEPEPETVENVREEKEDLDVTVTGPLGRLHRFKIPYHYVELLKKEM